MLRELVLGLPPAVAHDVRCEGGSGLNEDCLIFRGGWLILHTRSELLRAGTGQMCTRAASADAVSEQGLCLADVAQCM